ncbi:hypothetical protein SLIQ_08055 [Serratia liquefaciens FK01]|nr:hypothetical protein SLIQ_08055 [Serratia liquefaciens FK01]
MRALADASDRQARSAPAVILPASVTAINNRRSVKSKCIGFSYVFASGWLSECRIVRQARAADNPCTKG